MNDGRRNFANFRHPQKVKRDCPFAIDATIHVFEPIGQWTLAQSSKLSQ